MIALSQLRLISHLSSCIRAYVEEHETISDTTIELRTEHVR